MSPTAYRPAYDGLVHGTDVLKMLLNGSFNLIEERLAHVSDAEWNERAIPGTSKPGFILWHCARIVDWTVHSAIQGVPEIADAARWQARFPQEALYGAGIPNAVADELPSRTSKADTAEYLREVKAAATDWFGRQTDESLDFRPPMKANQAKHKGYLEPEVWAAVEDLDGLPAWQLLMRPSGAHIRRHTGEYDVLLEALRARPAVTPRA
jgi:DinB family protein